MTKILELPDALKERDMFGVFDDFDHYVTADTFTSVLTDSGSAAAGDAAGGILTITASDGTAADNDEAYVKGTKEIFKVAADKPIVFEACVKGVATSMATTNLIVGIKDAVAANTLVDNGAGPAASYDGAVFYAVDAGSYWVCESSNAGTQTTVTTDVSFKGGVYQVLRIEILPISSTVAEVHFFIDGVEVGLDDGDCQTVTITGMEEMAICLGVKAGAETNADTILVDYVGCYQLR